MSRSMVVLTWFSTDPNVSGDQGTFLWKCERTQGAFKHIDLYDVY